MVSADTRGAALAWAYGRYSDRVTTLRAALEEFLQPEQILDRPVDLAAYASDASFYRLVPLAVVRPKSTDEVRRLFEVSRRLSIPMTFRAAGTSLSGQAISDGLLVDVTRHFRGIQPLDHGRRVRAQPGAIGGHVNRVLAPFGARIGPDPASIDACTMGGILANNSSGMCCGVAENSYHTLESLIFLLPSGTLVDTAEPGAASALRRDEPALYGGLLALRDRLRQNAAVATRIRTKYRMRNTTGYSLNAFLDFDDPVDILRHLMIGSEGTLGFIAEAVLRTVPDLPVRYTGLLLFPDLEAACRGIGPLARSGASAIELMDRASLRAVADVPGVPADLRTAGPAVCGVLVEYQEPIGASIEAMVARATRVCADLRLETPARFSADPFERALLWRVRKGLFPSVGAVRARGTTVIIEDVAVPVDALAPAVADLQRLFAVHGYHDAIVFGHARDGNLHFVLSQSFNDRGAIAQYERFIAELVTLVVDRYGGALKGEHGTGRNMAPFVEAEWGPDAYAVMKALKALVDPPGLLNPGVILNDDPRAHVRHLKSLPRVEDEIDRCIECGFCEAGCPSRDLTLTPRQRIVIRREMQRPGADRRALSAAFRYDGIATCAVDGLCALACPVGIDTGQLTKRLRAERHSALARAAARLSARHFGVTETLARAGLRVAGRLPPHALERAGVPPPLPRAARALPTTAGSNADAIYFPACVTRVAGDLPDDPRPASVPETFVAVASRAGIHLHIPPSAARRCCGLPYGSKGYAEAHGLAANAALESLWQAADEGRLPIVVDTSPCAASLQSGEALSPANRDRLGRLRIFDAVEYFAATVLPRLVLRRLPGAAAIHPVCSLTKLGRVDALVAIAAACSESVYVPPSSGCCGFAGDRGWTVPELTASATRAMAAEVRARDAQGHYSSSRTCELGLTRATGRPYRSWIYLVDAASRRD